MVFARFWGIFAFRLFGPYLAYLDFIFADLEPVWGHLGPSRAHLEAILGDPGPIFGPSRASLAPLLRYLGQSWGRVGAMLGHLRLIWKAPWAILCYVRAPFHLKWPFWTHLKPSWTPIGAHLGPNANINSLMIMLERHRVPCIAPVPGSYRRVLDEEIK